MNWFFEQNDWTTGLLLMALVVDAWVLKKAYVLVGRKLFTLFGFNLFINALGSVIFWGYGALFNFWLFASVLQAIILFYTLLKYSEATYKKTKRILEHIAKSKNGSKKQVCIKHYERIMKADFKGACPDCPIVEQLNLNK